MMLCKDLDGIIDIMDYKIISDKIYILMKYYKYGDFFS